VTYTLALRPRAPALTQVQRMLLRIAGERIADVEYRPELASGLPFTQVERTGAEQLIATAAGLCPSCGLAHALALCQAIEALAEVEVAPRAAALRVLAAELERAASHLTTIAMLFEALGLAGQAHACAAQAGAAREALHALAGNLPGCWLTPGGLVRDCGLAELDGPATVAAQALKALFKLADRLISGRGLLARTVEVGVISTSAAEQFALSGPLARAAGLRTDLRHEAPYAYYATTCPDLVVQEGGDVYARLLVLLFEALESLKLVDLIANNPPGGAIASVMPSKLPTALAQSAVEAPRGPLHYRVETANGRLSTISCQVAPQLDRLLARTVLANACLDDAALIVLSTDPCDACLATATG
jgi:Ni,Fe-hydrogenase III large subunit